MARGKRSAVGDTRISPNGYHYTRTQDGWELTGRLVGGMILGRPMRDNERVRYLDGNRLNNDPNNIEVYEAKQKTHASRRAALEAKIAELSAELAELDLAE